MLPSSAWAAEPVVQSGTIAVGSAPVDIAITADGARAYVVNFGSDNVSVIDLSTGIAGTPIAVGNEPTSIAISPHGLFAYVTNYNNNGSSTLTRIDLVAGTSAAVSGTAGLLGPRSVVFSPDGSKAYVSNQASNPGKVTVIDTSSNAKITDISVANNPQNLAINADGTRLYVSSTGANTVSIFDLTTSPATLTASITGLSGPQGLALAGTSGSKLYVANQNASNIKVYNSSTGAAITTITGFNSPESVTVNPAGTQIFVANQGANEVKIIDLATETIVAVTPALTVGATPFYVAFAPNGLKAYVPNTGSTTVSVITYYQARTISFATTSYNLAYGASQTVTATPNIGAGTGTISYSAGSSTACNVNSSTGLVTMTAGTGTCSISSTITEGGTTVDNSYAKATTTTPVTITPQKVSLGVTAGNQTVAIGGTITPSYSLTSGTLVGSDALSGVTYTYQGTGSTTYSASSTAPTAAGTYSITPSAATYAPGTSTNYSVAYTAGALTISSNPITITAGTQTVQVGSPVSSSFTLTSGTLNGSDAITGVTYSYRGTGSTSYGPSNSAPTAAGTYSVTPSAAVFSPGNASSYTITYAAGSLTISTRAITLTAGIQNLNFGTTVTSTYSLTSGTLIGADTISGVTYTYQGIGSTTYSASTTAPTAAGTYSVTPSAATFSAGNASNYNITYITGQLTINPEPAAAVTLTLSANIGSPIVGSNADVTATGLRTNSSYELVVRSTPQTIATGLAVNGVANISAPLPSNLEAGWHSLTFIGTSADGTPTTSILYFKISSSGMLLQTSTTLPEELVHTGINVFDYIVLALALLIPGCYLATRKR